jgi:hypothetical protein
MIRTTTALCLLVFSSSLACAGTQQQQPTPRLQSGTQIAASTQPDPMNANARMKKKKMKSSMSKSGMDSGMGGGMDKGMKGGMKKDGM